MARTFLTAMLACTAIGRSLTSAADEAAGVPSEQPTPTVLVQATAIAGPAIGADKFPGNFQVLSAADLSRDGSASLTGAMNSQLGSVNVDDNLDDSFQPNILYRGFEASPVLGTPQGLAVYQNGVRINEAFGDTVDWDLFPDIAINRVELVSSSPVYGLNALGGAISVSMKDGFSYQGADFDLAGGSWGQRSGTAQYGVDSEHFGFYVAGRAFDSNGWRLFSSDKVRQLYSALGARSDRGSIELTYTLADNALAGQGAAPVQELAISRSLVFTNPQQYQDRLNFITLNGNLQLTSSWSLQGVGYYRQFSQSVSNGNTTSFTACTAGPYLGDLCQADGLTPAENAAGAPLPDITLGGTIPIGENDSERINSYGRGATVQIGDGEPIFGHTNQFTAGAAIDYAYVNFYSGTEVGVLNAQLVVQPSGLVVDTPEDTSAGTEFGATPVNLHSLTKDYGIYLTDTLDLTPALALTASGRYNVADIDLQDQLGTDLTGNNRYSHFNPAIGATYRVRAGLTAYAGASQNTRTPTASEIECSNPLQPCLLPADLAGDPPTLRQVVARTYELGLRDSAAAGGWSWNLGIFRTELNDDIYGIATSEKEGFFQNIGATRRQGVEAGLKYQAGGWSVIANYSLVDATFQSPILLPSPSNPFQDASGNIQVEPGDHLPGIPRQRLKLIVDYKLLPALSAGATVSVVGGQYYFGDESNQLQPMAGYTVVGVHASLAISHGCELFATINNLFDASYSNYGILGNPTGIGVPGIPPAGVANGPGVDNRFQSPSNPFSVSAGVKISF
ncbi:MAG TPA: TonB-dependent receptor [Steroidobacteraceae bacterium]